MQHDLELHSFQDPPPGNTKTIAQMASRHNVTLRTLRFYEGQGMLTPVRVGLARFYTPKDEIRLQLILKGKSLGFTLADIKGFIACGEEKNETTGLPFTMSRQQMLAQIDMLERDRKRVESALQELYAARDQRPK